MLKFLICTMGIQVRVGHSLHDKEMESCMLFDNIPDAHFEYEWRGCATWREGIEVTGD